MKHCPKCNQEKPFEAFYASSTHKSGYASWCKECEAVRSKAKFKLRKEAHFAKSKQWRNANKDKQNAATKAWRESNSERTAAMYRGTCKSYPLCLISKNQTTLTKEPP